MLTIHSSQLAALPSNGTLSQRGSESNIMDLFTLHRLSDDLRTFIPIVREFLRASFLSWPESGLSIFADLYRFSVANDFCRPICHNVIAQRCLWNLANWHLRMRLPFLNCILSFGGVVLCRRAIFELCPKHKSV